MYIYIYIYIYIEREREREREREGERERERESTMHIIPWQSDPTPSSQVSIDLWKTITPYKFQIYI